MPTEEKTAKEWIDEMVLPENLTLDLLYDRDPRTLTAEQRMQILVLQRQDRARFTKRQEDAAFKRKTGEEPPKDEEKNDEEAIG